MLLSRNMRTMKPQSSYVNPERQIISSYEVVQLCFDKVRTFDILRRSNIISTVQVELHISDTPHSLTFDLQSELFSHLEPPSLHFFRFLLSPNITAVSPPPKHSPPTKSPSVCPPCFRLESNPSCVYPICCNKPPIWFGPAQA